MSISDSCAHVCRQATAAREAIADKKLELVSLLLRGDGGEYKKKMEELAVIARQHRESLIQEYVPLLFFSYRTIIYSLGLEYRSTRKKSGFDFTLVLVS
jgi:hypothetical protein